MNPSTITEQVKQVATLQQKLNTGFPTGVDPKSVQLAEKQRQALKLASEGRNLFLTGAGGTGKSFLIHTIVAELLSRNRRVALTALTGCAALLLGQKAKTIHSWAGIGLGRDSPHTLVQNINKNFKAKCRWLLTDTLIIDEVSMLTPELLEKLDAVAKGVRRNASRFGGMQIILVGDFQQLPPVNKESAPADSAETQRHFAFESELWQQLIDETVQLDVIHRQKDSDFQAILTEARSGHMSKQSLTTLAKRITDSWKDLEIRPTLLFSRRLEVDRINRDNLEALEGPNQTQEAKTEFTSALPSGLHKDSDLVKQALLRLDNNAPQVPTLTLRKGAQVMLTQNLDAEAGLVNGSRGVVTGFTADVKHSPIVKFQNGLSMMMEPQSWESDELDGLKRSQIPLILAWAVTIHKCQGATLDSALIDIGPSIFEAGQAQVALSRVKSLESLYLWDLNAKAFRSHPKVQKFYAKLNQPVTVE